MSNEIYNSSWWGLSYPNGFGNIYNNYNITRLYNERVLSDGGIIEALDCVNQIFK